MLENPEEISKRTIQSTFQYFIQDILRNFRKIIYEEPQNEKDVQKSLERFLAVKEYKFKREKESTGFSSKSFKPDFTNDDLSIAIEVKYIDKQEKVSVCVEGLSADIIPYSGKWKNLLFLVYDKGGNIRDVDEFSNDFSRDGDIKIRCIIIKH